MASKRAIRRKSCGRKQRFDTAAAGQQAIYRLNRAKGYQGHMDCYRCRFCNSFHIGHSKARRVGYLR